MSRIKETEGNRKSDPWVSNERKGRKAAGTRGRERWNQRRARSGVK